ncbi:hypothetical protein ACOME3_006122 [Neoechinorhynchus agilis]
MREMNRLFILFFILTIWLVKSRGHLSNSKNTTSSPVIKKSQPSTKSPSRSINRTTEGKIPQSRKNLQPENSKKLNVTAKSTHQPWVYRTQPKTHQTDEFTPFELNCTVVREPFARYYKYGRSGGENIYSKCDVFNESKPLDN